MLSSFVLCTFSSTTLSLYHIEIMESGLSHSWNESDPLFRHSSTAASSRVGRRNQDTRIPLAPQVVGIQRTPESPLYARRPVFVMFVSTCTENVARYMLSHPDVVRLCWFCKLATHGK